MFIYRAQKWLEFLNVENVCNYQRICLGHFEEKCFKKIYPRRLLRNDPIPTIMRNDLPSLENNLEENTSNNIGKIIYLIT